jgi:IAA-amino acid hydrolase
MLIGSNLQFVLCLLWFISSPISGLPFRTRGTASTSQNDDDDHEGTNNGNLADAVIEGGWVSDIYISKSSPDSRRNVAVESFFASPSDATSRALKDDVQTRAVEMFDFLVSTRRALHRHPELMYNEKETSAYVQGVLRQLDIPFTTGWAVNTVPDAIPGPGGYGVVADIGTGGEPCVLLRADMDALPIVERTEGIDGFTSTHPGKMHACGHDGHTTMLLGAAAVLKDMEHSINGTVRLMFQPAEEGGAGGKRMREEGVLARHPRPRQAYGLHVWPTIPSGTIASRPGPLLAACERFEILIAGVGGHAAMPHLTIDPIVTASSIIMNLQTIVSRTLSPLESGVCSITAFQSGDAFNVIPASALLRGTIRALSTETLLSLRDKVDHIVRSTAEVHHCNVTITYSPDFYPPTINDPDLFESFSKDVGALVSDSGILMDIEPTMGAEDFSFVAETVPSTFFLLGQGSGKNPDTNYGLHHPHFALDESVLPRGVELHVNLALRALQRLSEDASTTLA